MKVLVVASHPVPDSYGASLRATVVDSLRASGHEVRVRDLDAQDFDPVMSLDERRAHLGPAADKVQLLEYAQELADCDVLVLVYPTWWGGQPARLKGWIDRVWINEIAWALPEGSNRLIGRLRRIRRIIVVTTHGSPKWINMIQGEPGKRVITRSLRLMCSPWTRVTWLAAYGLDRAEENARRRFSARVENRMRGLRSLRRS